MVLLWILMILVIILVSLPFVLNRIFFKLPKHYSRNRNHETLSSLNRPVLIQSGKNQLKGYLYGENNTKGMVVFSHGMGVTSDYYLPEVLYFVEKGYRVLSFDDTAYRHNPGHFEGFCQAIHDLDAALHFAEGQGLPISMVGHSMGGYAVAAVLGKTSVKVKSILVYAGFNSQKEIFTDVIHRNVKFLPGLCTAFVCLFHKVYFGSDFYLTAVDGINKAQCNVVVAQGANDEQVLMDKTSLYSKVDQIHVPHIERFAFMEGERSTHVGVVRAKEGEEINRKVLDAAIRMMEM